MNEKDVKLIKTTLAAIILGEIVQLCVSAYFIALEIAK